MNGIVPKYKIVTKTLLVVFWIAACYAFPLQETIPALYEKICSYVGLLSDAVLIALGLWTIRKRVDIIVLASLIVIATVASKINGLSTGTLINGLRIYVPMVMLMVIIRYLLSTRERIQYFLPRMDRALYLFLLLQIPAMFIQFLRYGAYDQVGGTLGWMMSGIVSTLIFIISFYLLLRRWDPSLGYLENLRKNWILPTLLLLTMLNETKISFIYFVLYFFFLIPMDRKFMKRMILIIPIFALLFGVTFYIYKQVQVNVDQQSSAMPQTSTLSWEFIETYTLGNQELQEMVLSGFMEDVMPELETNDFARGIKFITVPILLSSEPHAWYVGFGVGHFKGGTILEETKFYKEYKWLLQGTQITVQMIALEMGVAGLLWLTAFFLVMFRAFRKVRCRNKRLTWFMSIITVMILLYTAPNLVFPFMLIMTFVIMISSRWSLLKYVEKPKGLFLPPIATTDGQNPSAQ